MIKSSARHGQGNWKNLKVIFTIFICAMKRLASEIMMKILSYERTFFLFRPQVFRDELWIYAFELGLG